MEVPDELIERYKRIEPEFEKIQKELGEIWTTYIAEKVAKMMVLTTEDKK
jgi:hypothetical protein